MKKWIFCAKTSYVKILKAKNQLQFGSQVMIHRLAIFNKLNWSMRGAGAPNGNFRKISVRKTIWDLEFSEQLL